MRVVIEETNNKKDNKQRAVLECEDDDATLDVALSLALRALYAYGYKREDVTKYLMGVFTDADFTKSEEELEQEKHPRPPVESPQPTGPTETQQALHLPK